MHIDVWREHPKSLHCFVFYCTLLSTLLPKPLLFTANWFLYKHVPEASSSSLLCSLCFPHPQFWLQFKIAPHGGAISPKINCIALHCESSIDQNNTVTHIWRHLLSFFSPLFQHTLFLYFPQDPKSNSTTEFLFFQSNLQIKNRFFFP